MAKEKGKSKKRKREVASRSVPTDGPCVLDGNNMFGGKFDERNVTVSRNGIAVDEPLADKDPGPHDAAAAAAAAAIPNTSGPAPNNSLNAFHVEKCERSLLQTDVKTLKDMIAKDPTIGIVAMKVVGDDYKGKNNTEFKVDEAYYIPSNTKPVLCKWGYHASYSPLLCLSFTHEFKQPVRLLKVRVSGNLQVDPEKLCGSNIEIIEEIKGEERDKALTGTCLRIDSEKPLQHYKNGLLHDYSNGVPAVLSSRQPPSSRMIRYQHGTKTSVLYWTKSPFP